MMKLGVCVMLVALAGCGGSSEEPEAGPDIFTEHHPGSLVITAPARAAFIPSSSGAEVTVTGSGATGALEINGVPVEPGADGSFTTTITATDGLNLIRVVAGEQSLDTPFLYGRFEPAATPAHEAVAVRINTLGYANPDDAALSLTSLAKAAVDDIDLLAPLDGTTYTGSIPGGSWKYVVESTQYGATHVKLSPRAGGAKFDFRVADVRVNGRLTVEVLLSKTDDATLSADEVTITGNVDAGLDQGAVSMTGSSVQAQLQGFRYDSNNAGFPCCVDGIVTDYLRPKVRDAVQNEVRKVMQNEIAFALNQLGLPSSFDFEGAAIAIDQSFDGAWFESEGSLLSAAAGFQSSADSEAPGWLSVSRATEEVRAEPPFGMSIALDALNQALFAVWSVNGLARTLDGIPLAETIEMKHALPPVVLADDSGVTAAAGEIVVDAEIEGAPVRAAISIIDDIAIAIEGDALVLTPSATPQISVTWLDAEALSPELRDIIKSTILAELPKLLTPVSLPIPSLPLDGIASSFGSSTAVLGPDASVSIESGAQRLALWGSLVVTDQ